MRTHPIDYYRGRLKVSKHQLDDELEEHAELLDQIGQAVAATNTLAIEMKDKLGKVEGRVSDQMRDLHEKATVGAINSMVQRHPERVAAYERWVSAREDHEQWQSLHEAWKARGYGISTLSGLYANQYFALKSTSARVPSKRSYDEGRAAMRQAEPAPRRRLVE